MVVVFSGSFEERLADPGLTGDLPYGDGLASCPQPSGEAWLHLPGASGTHSQNWGQPFIPALATGEAVSMVAVPGALDPLKPEGVKEEGGRASQTLPGTHRGQDAVSPGGILAAQWASS